MDYPLLASSSVRPGLAWLPRLALAVGLAGCGNAVVTYQCQPACPSGLRCVAGGCVADSSGPDLAVGSPADLAVGCSPACSGATPFCDEATSTCIVCRMDADCPSGTRCQKLGALAQCLPGCADDSRCTAGQKCCGGACTDVMSDAANCSACGTTCAAPHASTSCQQGACVPGACASGWGDCNGDPTDGCETNVALDATHCGGCDRACAIPNALAACSGACYIAACQFGWGDCNGDAGDGCELGLLSDLNNCGACGNSCPGAPHSTPACVNATCQLASCTQGFSDCDGSAVNGCEVPTGSDNANCGACGNACAMGLVCRNSACTCPNCNFPNAKSRCVNGVCALGACLPGWGDCNAVAKDGCENPLSDDANCGGCGLACQMGQHCFSGQCQDKFVFQMNQQIDGQPVTCSMVINTDQYTECDDMQESGMYFPNGIVCGLGWSLQNPRTSDTIGLCQSLTGTAKAESFFTCAGSINRATWFAHVWGTTNDNGYTQHVRCYY